MPEFNNLASYHDVKNNTYLNVRKGLDGGLYLEIHRRGTEKYCALFLNNEQASDLSKVISELYK